MGFFLVRHRRARVFFVIEVLPRVRVDVEERFLQQERFAAQHSVLEVYQAFRVECLAVVAGLEMQMGSRRAARRAAQSDDLPRFDPLVRLYQAFRQVAVVGFQAVVVADDYQIAVAAVVVGRHAHSPAERRINRVARLQRQVHSLVLASSPRAVSAVRVYSAFVGAVVALGRVHQVDDHRVGHRRHVYVRVGKQVAHVPEFLEDGLVFHHFAVADVFPRVVAVKHYQQRVVFRRKRVHHNQFVRVERRLYLFGFQAQAQGRQRVGGRGFGRGQRRKPRRFFLRRGRQYRQRGRQCKAVFLHGHRFFSSSAAASSAS